MKLPNKCFISHSYKDKNSCKKLVKSLPPNVKPYFFPPIEIAPDEMVSNELIEKILDREALIYLEGGYSSSSFWVAFERDFALRAGKPVYAFNPTTKEFTPHTAPPLDLHVFVSHSPFDRDRVNEVVRFMREERFFDALSFSFLPTSRTPTDKRIRQNIIEKISRGGYLVAFLSKHSEESSFLREEVELALNYGQFYAPDTDNPDYSRVLFARLDDAPLPGWLADRISLQPESVVKPVQMYRDRDLSETNRVDDLIVRLYWLIYRNTQQGSLV